jgi:purine nucleosidase
MTLVLVDTDPGIDDALALLQAWGTPGLAVEALTTVAGNVDVEAATTNVRRLLALRRPAPPPRVARGAAAPLARPLVTATDYHGRDGLGDLADWPAAGGVPAPRGDAVDLMRETIGRHGQALTLVALGPLTNLARLAAADAGALARVGRVIAMGGALDVPGNVTATAEFNLHVDPEAAAQVLAAGARLDLVPLDATRQVLLPRGELLEALRGAPAPVADRVARLTERAFAADARHGRMTLHDPLAMAAAADPTLVAWEPVRLTIGHDGTTRRAAGPPNCRVAVRADAPRVLRAVLDALGRLA